jgi:anti-repressor protein
LNEIQIFNNTEFGEIRTVEINDKPYFVANDIAKALGYKRVADAVTAHCKGSVKHRYLTEGGEQEIKVIPEGDVYRLIARSKLPQAEKFEKWVFDEVLPSIRKTGGYIAGQEHMTDDELLANAILVAQRKIAERDKVIQAQNDTITELKPKAVFADAVSSSKTSILIGDMAKLLRQNGIEIGQKRLFDWLRNNGYLIKRKGSDWNMPTQRSVEMGLFEIKESTHLDGNGCNITTKTSKVTGKGQVYFINKFLKATV